MSKYEWITPLEGIKEWPEWSRNMKKVFQENKVWGYVEGDPNAWDKYPIQPMPAKPTQASDPVDIGLYQTWWKKDALARSLLTRHMAPMIANTISLEGQGTTEKITACKMWSRLKETYAKTDPIAKATLKRQIAMLRLKDHHNFA